MKTRTSHQQHSSRRGAWRLVRHALLLGLLLPWTAPFGLGGVPALAQQGRPTHPLAGLMRGEVSEVGKQSIVINNKRYDVREAAVIADDRGQPRALKDFEPGHEVAYQLRTGQIEHLVLIIPK